MHVGAIGGQHKQAGGSLAFLGGFLALATFHGSVATAAEGDCSPMLARVVSIQGGLEVLRANSSQWNQITRLDTPICQGDRLRTKTRSRAALFVRPETVTRIDENTTVAISQSPEGTELEFFDPESAPDINRGSSCGKLYAITRFPKKFKAKSRLVSGSVEGTEFQLAMRCESTELSVFEGKVLAEFLATNAEPVKVSSGESVTAGEVAAEAVKLIVSPVDAVQWALYYPPILEAGTEPASADDCKSLEPALAHACFVERADQLLRVGRVDEASEDVQQALAADPNGGEAHAILAIIKVVKNDKAGALGEAKRATDAAPNSIRAWLALSYAHQAHFELDAALKSAQQAAQLGQGSALTHARVAELLMSLGRIGEAEKEAKLAVDTQPKQSRAHLIVGFVHLAQINTKLAKADFLQAIELDSSDPLARLGLGLAIIREGHLQKGREEIEIAVGLDPTNSLIRSYVGRAYLEERTVPRSRLAQEQFDLAGRLDPLDPTPLFYSAVAKSESSRPIEALHEMQESVDRNENRSVYRPRTALDQDAAARSVALARLYTDMGFEEPAREEVTLALTEDPKSFAAHQYLSDIASYEDRQQFTRASAGLQAQLRQPLGIDAPLVGLTGSNSLVPGSPYLSVSSIGPQRPGMYDFDPVFSGPGLKGRVQGLLGDFGTNSYLASAIASSDKVSVALGTLHATSDGQRINNDQLRDASSALVSVRATTSLTVQLDLQLSDAFFGDLPIRWDETNVSLNDRNVERYDTSRLAMREELSPEAELLFAFTYAKSKAKLTDNATPFSIEFDRRFTSTEAQYVQTINTANFIVGASFVDGNQYKIFDFPGIFTDTSLNADREQTAYVYATAGTTDHQLELTTGAEWDKTRLQSVLLEREQTYPKIGLLFRPSNDTAIRAAYFEAIQRLLASGQTLEPVQVAGFSQMYDDPFGATSQQAAAAFDKRIGNQLFIGADVMRRDIAVPFIGSNLLGQLIGAKAHWGEDRDSAYVRWLPSSSVAVSLQAIRERFGRTQENQGTGAFLTLEQIRVPVTLQWFGESGVSSSFRVTYLHQEGIFCAFGAATCDLAGAEKSTVADFGVSYKLPNRRGMIGMDILNVFDERFRYQSIDTSKLVPFTGRAFFARVTLGF